MHYKLLHCHVMEPSAWEFIFLVNYISVLTPQNIYNPPFKIKNHSQINRLNTFSKLFTAI